MVCFRIILCLVSVYPIFGMKVNMQGSLKLGKDVMDTLSHYMRRNMNSRRSGGRNHETAAVTGDLNTDTISLLVNSADLCKDLEFCQGHETVKEYVIALTKTIETTFEGLMEKPNNNDLKSIIFEEELKFLLKEINELLEVANDSPNADRDINIWLDLLKKISAKFRERALEFISTQGLDGNTKEIKEVMKMLTQKLTIDLTNVELDFERKLCSKQSICTISYECTKAFDTLMQRIENLPEDKVKDFVKYFYGTVPDTGFYNLISDVTVHEFQYILNDMAYVENTPTQDVLSTVHKSVKDRLDFVQKNVAITGGADVKLLHVILSDFDHFYNKQIDPFRSFLKSFEQWSEKPGGKFNSPLRKVMIDISKKVASQSEELMLKLKNEVRVFLEITVDPVKQ